LHYIANIGERKMIQRDAYLPGQMSYI
jgi:hypothetical protein